MKTPPRPPTSTSTKKDPNESRAIALGYTAKPTRALCRACGVTHHIDDVCAVRDPVVDAVNARAAAAYFDSAERSGRQMERLRARRG